MKAEEEFASALEERQSAPKGDKQNNCIPIEKYFISTVESPLGEKIFEIMGLLHNYCARQ